jgi:hypothetical protein
MSKKDLALIILIAIVASYVAGFLIVLSSMMLPVAGSARRFLTDPLAAVTDTPIACSTRTAARHTSAGATRWKTTREQAHPRRRLRIATLSAL